MKRVYPSPMNPRKTFDEDAIRELAESIERQGLLQPITVRPVSHPNKDEFPRDYPDKYEIVCGERRYRACMMLQQKWSQMELVAPDNRFSSILAVVREMNDDEAFDAMITENLQRKDVDPMEEAFAFSQLIEKGNKAEDVAARFGKSVRFVQDRVKLNSLIPEFRPLLKDGVLPLSGAIIISKLGEDEQKVLFGRVGKRNNISKRDVESEIEYMFMRLDKSVWEKGGYPDFEGGCEKSCAVCEFNTANHGCLFYEMKTETGKCTNRKRFDDKTLRYMLFRLAKENALPKGAELDGRKVVAIEIASEWMVGAKQEKERLKELIEEKGYEVVEPNKVFSGKCYYSPEDERIEELLEKGEIYPVFNLYEYGVPNPRLEFWWLRKDEESQSDHPRLPGEVRDVLTKYTIEEANDGNVTLNKAILKHYKPGREELNAVERKLFTLLYINNKSEFRSSIGLEPYGEREGDYKFVDANPDVFNLCLRKIMTDALGYTPGVNQAAPMLDQIGALWCRDEYLKALEKEKSRHEKELKKLRDKLAELGYDTEGNKISWSEEEVNEIPLPVTHELYEQFADLKLKHPDAILIFRVGDFYEIFGDEADFTAELLGLTVTKSAGDRHSVCSFPHHALDEYLPKLTRSGRRVAICETK